MRVFVHVQISMTLATNAQRLLETGFNFRLIDSSLNSYSGFHPTAFSKQDHTLVMCSWLFFEPPDNYVHHCHRAIAMMVWWIPQTHCFNTLPALIYMFSIPHKVPASCLATTVQKYSRPAHGNLQACLHVSSVVKT